MIKALYRLMIVPILSISIFAINSCSSSGGIDNYLTFNIVQSHALPVDSGFTNSIITYRSVLDSAALAENGTNAALIRSVKMTRFVLTSNQPGFPPYSVLDSLTTTIVDSTGKIITPLAHYYGSNDSTYLTNNDFGAYIHNGNYAISFYYHTFPKGLVYTANYTLVVTAQQQQ